MRWLMMAVVLSVLVGSVAHAQAPADEEAAFKAIDGMLDEGNEALKAQERQVARERAEEALELLDVLQGEGEATAELLELRLGALGLLLVATHHADKERALEAAREALALSEEAGDKKQLAWWVRYIADNDWDLPDDQRAAMRARVRELYRETEQWTQLAEALLSHGWREISRGRFAEGFALIDDAREAVRDKPYAQRHAYVEATDEFRRLIGDELDVRRKVRWAAGSATLKVEGERLAHRGGPGHSCSNGPPEDMARFSEVFEPLAKIGWLPHTGPGVGYEEEKNTFSYTANPTETFVWIEADDETVKTPAGTFEGCMLLRATTTESPPDEGTESRERELNRVWCGERYLWLARGVGPVRFRHERTDNIVVDTVLTKFECPEKRTEWVPLVLGTRWEYQPAEPPEDFDALIVHQLTHIGDDGTAYLATTMVGMRKGE